MFSFDPNPQNFMKIWCGLWILYVLKFFSFSFSLIILFHLISLQFYILGYNITNFTMPKDHF
jgi:hypothetical protein